MFKAGWGALYLGCGTCGSEGSEVNRDSLNPAAVVRTTAANAERPPGALAIGSSRGRRSSKRRPTCPRVSVASAATVVCAASALSFAGCGASGHSVNVTAASARRQVIPAVEALYRQLAMIRPQIDGPHGRLPVVEDGSYAPCAPSTRLHYSRSVELEGKGVRLGPYNRRIISAASSVGWTLHRIAIRDLPDGGPFANPANLDPATLVYLMRKGVGRAALLGVTFVGPQPGHYGILATITINGPCFDAGSATNTLDTVVDSSPIPPATRPNP
jgi:hypothetical protein